MVLLMESGDCIPCSSNLGSYLLAAVAIDTTVLIRLHGWPSELCRSLAHVKHEDPENHKSCLLPSDDDLYVGPVNPEDV